MKIEAVDFYYLALPVIRDIGDGSQDALLVRVEAGGHVGWGECEAAPLVCMASWNCPMSHSACKPVSASVLGQRLDSTDDILRINALVRARSADLLQADHTLSGIDVALWDLLGKRLGEPVWRLLGYQQAFPKTAYASQLFGDDPQQTLRAARRVANSGFKAAKFGWGPYGCGTVKQDGDHVRAAREDWVRTPRCWWMPARCGATTWPRRGRGFGLWNRAGLSGWRSLSSPARWRRTAGWPNAAAR